MPKLPKTQYDTPEFKKLFQEWNKRLELTGHTEIEDFKHPDIPLKRWHGQDFKAKFKSPEVFMAKAQYFQQATELLNTFKFSSKKDRIVWRLHSEGYTISEVSAVCKKNKMKKVSKSSVRTIIFNVARLGGIL